MDHIIHADVDPCVVKGWQQSTPRLVSDIWTLNLTVYDYIIIIFSIAIDGYDFTAVSRAVMLRAGGGVACALFPILNDSLALELKEEFGVSFELLGPTDTEGRLLLNNGRAIATPGVSEARVRIMDANGMWAQVNLKNKNGGGERRRGGSGKFGDTDSGWKLF